MINPKTLSSSITRIAKEKGLPFEKVEEALNIALAAAYKKQYGKKGENIKAKFNLETGDISFSKILLVVNENMIENENEKEKNKNNSEEKKEKIRFNPERHILLEEAQKINPKIKVGEELIIPLEEHHDFGRIAAQTAKQVILQKIREFEKDFIKEEFKKKEGNIVSGLIQKIERGNIYVDLGKVSGVMFPNESIPGEHYRIGQRMRFLVLAVQDQKGGPFIVLSRSHPDFVKKLFEIEVPEIAEGIVEIKEIAREPGYRTKIAVFSNEENLDPIGSCIGQRGMRVMAVTSELGQERIDVIKWDPDSAKFIANALSPAKIISVELLPKREAKVLVDENQLSLALGKSGQNVRLAAKLTSFKIEVNSLKEEKEKKNKEDEERRKKENSSENKIKNETEEENKEYIENNKKNNEDEDEKEEQENSEQKKD